ncbi:MAG: GatB/YqeY domain-containing protein [Desulforhopalus sp.]
MSLQESLREDLKVAMKARDTDRTGAIRILMGEFARQPEKVLSDEQVIAIVKKLIKSERELLAAQNQEGSSFLTIMEEYLPKQASEEEIYTWVEKNIDFSAYGSKMQAMKPIMQHFGSAVDGNTVKKVLQRFD